MSIYFLRHLKTDGNQKNIISGSNDSAMIIQNQEIAYFNNLPLQFDIILCSTLKRCIQTINDYSDLCYKSIIFSEKLIERNMGILEGMSKSTAQRMYPEFFFNNKVDIKAKIPNGESINDVKERLESIVKFVEENIKNDILICSHNQTLKVLYALLRDIPITNEYWSMLNFKNGVIINIDDVKYVSTL